MHEERSPYDPKLRRSRAGLLVLALAGLFLVMTACEPVFSPDSEDESAPSSEPESPTDDDSISEPDFPRDVSATTLSDTSIEVEWNSVPEADHYTVFRTRNIVNEEFTQIADNLGETRYTDAGLEPATTYYYKVRATNSAGDSPKSSLAYVTTDDIPIENTSIGTPSDLSIVDRTGTSLEVAFETVADAESYRVYVSSNPSGEYEYHAQTASSPVSVSGLLSSTLYYIKISAVGSSGEGARSDYVYGLTTSSETNPTPPSGGYIGGSVYTSNGTFLGLISSLITSDSLANQFGTYGNEFNSLSIWNDFGTYGSSFSTYSAYNTLATSPPEIYVNGIFYAYLTKNTIKIPRVDPDSLAVAIGRNDVVD